MLRKPFVLEGIVGEIERLAKDYANERNVMRLHFYKPDEVLNQVRDLGIERRDFSSDMTQIPETEMFISDD